MLRYLEFVASDGRLIYVRGGIVLGTVYYDCFRVQLDVLRVG